MVKKGTTTKNSGKTITKKAASPKTTAKKATAKNTQELPEYYSYLNQSLLNHLPENLGMVLDIGCGSGELGDKYKSDNQKSIWHGIDIHAPAIKVAKTKLDQAWVMDANSLEPNAIMKKKKYDALVYSLSLEQLKDPQTVILEHLKLLKPTGKLFICFPNVQHWTLLRHVISGNWEYEERGILQADNQHFFTRKSFTRMLDAIDLKRTEMFRYSYENTRLFIRKRGTRIKTLEKLKYFCQTTQLVYNENDLRTYHYVMVVERK